VSALLAVFLEFGDGAELGFALGFDFGFESAFCADGGFAGAGWAVVVYGAEGACAGG
jgi:hypothetical protein